MFCIEFEGPIGNCGAVVQFWNITFKGILSAIAIPLAVLRLHHAFSLHVLVVLELGGRSVSLVASRRGLAELFHPHQFHTMFLRRGEHSNMVHVVTRAKLELLCRTTEAARLRGRRHCNKYV